MATGIYGGECIQHHTAMIFDRGGQNRLGPVVDLSSLRYERARDNVSTASIRVEGDACAEQAEFLQSLRSHRHEMVIYRGQERVWEGPIHRIASHGSYTEIHARDVIEYLQHTPMSQRYNNSYPNTTEVTTRIGNIIGFELSSNRTQLVNGSDYPVIAWENLDPPVNILPHLVVHHFPNEARTTADTLPYEMTIGQHLHNLARQSGIDFTAIGRSIHIWDVSRSLGRIPITLTEANFLTDVIVTEYGADHRQGAFIVAQSGNYGQYLNTDNLEYYGPWMDITTAFNEEGTEEPSQSELNSQAQRQVSGRSPVPLEVRVPDNSGVILSDSLTMNMLVPGTEVMLRARLNARPLTQMQKIDHVVVKEDSDGELIQLTLTPTTRADSDEIAETA